MRVIDAYKPHVETPASRASGAEAPKGVSSAEGSARESSPSVKVNVSSKARELLAQGEANLEKVERLRGAIENGSFQIRHDEIAGKIVEENG